MPRSLPEGQKSGRGSASDGIKKVPPGGLRHVFRECSGTCSESALEGEKKCAIGFYFLSVLVRRKQKYTSTKPPRITIPYKNIKQKKIASDVLEVKKVCPGAVILVSQESSGRHHFLIQK